MSNEPRSGELDMRYFEFENNEAQLTKKVKRWLFLYCTSIALIMVSVTVRQWDVANDNRVTIGSVNVY